MSLLTAIIVGGIAGWIATMIMHAQNSILIDIILGIIGAFVGTLIVNAFGIPGVTGLNISSIIVSLIGAIIVIAIGRMFTRHTI